MWSQLSVEAPNCADLRDMEPIHNGYQLYAAKIVRKLGIKNTPFLDVFGLRRPSSSAMNSSTFLYAK